ncbi:PAS domain-containing protein [Caulobacter radicis]
MDRGRTRKGTTMFHPSTERLIDYWRNRAGDGRMPARASVDPGDFLDLLPQVFILGRGNGRYPFRLAGGFVTDLHARDLRGEDQLSMWALSHRLEVKSALEVARRRGEPVVVTADIRAHGVASVGMEVLLAPMTGASGEADRFLGLYQPIAMMQRLMGRPAYELGVRRIQALAPTNAEAPRLRLASLDGRLIA